MATRRETEAQREQLQNWLRDACEDGTFVPGALLPPVREIAARRGVSLYVAHRAISVLSEEGILCGVPRVGTFAGPLKAPRGLFFLMVVPDGAANQVHYIAQRTGFEDRIAHKGGAVIAMEWSEALRHYDADDLPRLSGVFDLVFQPNGGLSWAHEAPESAAALVRFHTQVSDALGYDEISFDDFDGGRRATRHLIESGHKRIAFFALHSLRHDSGQMSWSSERENGWRAAMEEAGLATENLTFHPEKDVAQARELERRAGCEMATRFLRESDADAVVAANDACAHGLIEALRLNNIAPENWPAIIGFDGDPTLSRNLLTSLRLPWDELGRAAADLLWERSHGLLDEERQHRQVKMKLIQRLSCRTNGSHSTRHNALLQSVA